MKIDLNHFTTSKHYCNKIWQAVRYAEMFLDQSQMKLDRIELNKVCGL